MNTKSKLAALREHHYGLASLPEMVRIPALGLRRDETVKPVETATVDDLAFALLGLNQQASALYREIDALRTVYDEARKAGVLGAEIAIDALIAAQGGKR
jgi:hypothetical protein